MGLSSSGRALRARQEATRMIDEGESPRIYPTIDVAGGTPS